MPISQERKDIFTKIRSEFNAYLEEGHGPLQFQIDGHAITNGEIFEAFMYGKYAHLTQHETINGWERLVSYDGKRAGFDRVLGSFIQTLFYLRTECEKIDAELAEQGDM